jgi:predicted ester cyclase
MESALWQDGVMVEHWGVADNVGLLAQMGLLPLDKFPSFSVDKLGKTFQQQLAHPPTIHPLTAPTPQAKLTATSNLSKAVPAGNMWLDSAYVAPNYADYEYYGQGYPTKAVDKHKMAIGVNKTAIPDLVSKIHELQVIGPQVFGILEASGRNDGPYLGIPATGRLVDINVFEYWHFNSKGQVDVHNGVADLFGLVSELGFIPPGSVPVYSQSKVDSKFLPELKKG